MAGIRRIQGAHGVPPELKGGVTAIGNFDGVHRGHQAVLGDALTQARVRGAPALVLTFEPHPRRHFRPDEPHFALTPAPLKARLLDALGFDAVVEQNFGPDLAQMEAARFVRSLLVDQLVLSCAVTGFDFHFGQGRAGTPSFLAEASRALGFDVRQVPAFRDEGGEIVSSSRIRALLGEGEVVEAAGLLGYRWLVEGTVEGGRRLGRTLGYPTANMRLPEGTMLKHGIYAVRFRRADGSLYDGVASFGRRPTVEEEGAPLLETYLFDFSGDLYGEKASVSFFGFLRSEAKFENLDALMAQMRRDEADARALLAGVQPLGTLDAALSF
ncbi:MAG TPA: bifunctional riboflavin kinase/FAD synthetase [Mesorhizobium sp.]|jgi:riboflavin kinase/FMN adenylyltransferase|nr:bifunctional riboflavin kinase/FAD synthetase [Mesorhizobium sp.]